MCVLIACVCYGQNGGVIAGAVIGSLFVLALIAGIIFAVLYYKRSRNTDGALYACVVCKCGVEGVIGIALTQETVSKRSVCI